MPRGVTYPAFGEKMLSYRECSNCKTLFEPDNDWQELCVDCQSPAKKPIKMDQDNKIVQQILSNCKKGNVNPVINVFQLQAGIENMQVGAETEYLEQAVSRALANTLGPLAEQIPAVLKNPPNDLVEELVYQWMENQGGLKGATKRLADIALQKEGSQTAASKKLRISTRTLRNWQK